MPFANLDTLAIRLDLLEGGGIEWEEKHAHPEALDALLQRLLTFDDQGGYEPRADSRKLMREDATDFKRDMANRFRIPAMLDARKVRIEFAAVPRYAAMLDWIEIGFEGAGGHRVSNVACGRDVVSFARED